MKTFAHIFLTLATLFMLQSSPCAADTSVKDLIFRDCAKSQSVFASLANSEKENLVPFLREVLKLKVDALREALPALPGKIPGNIPGADTDLGSIWRSFSPDRELEAKRCALNLLSSVPTLAAPAIPDILSLASDPTTAESFLEHLDAAIFAISAPLLQLSTPESVEKLVPAAIEHLNTLGDIVLAYLPTDMAMRGLWKLSPKFSAEQKVDFVKLAPWLDPSGQITQTAALEVNLEADPGLVAKILGGVNCPTAGAVRHLRTLLKSEVEEISKEARAALENLVRTVRDETRCPAEIETVSGSELLVILFEDLQSPDPREADRLALALPLLAGRNNARALDAIRAGLGSPATQSKVEPDIATQALIHLGHPAREIILEALETKNITARQRASFALEKLQLEDAKKLRPFVRYLADQDAEVRRHVYRAVLPAAKELRGEIRKTFGSSHARIADYSALALSKAGAATPLSNSVILAALGNFPCRSIAELLGVIDLNSPAVLKLLIEKGQECLLKSPGEACEAIGWITSNDSIEKALSSVIDSHYDSQNPVCTLNAYRSAILRKNLSIDAQAIAALLRSEDELVFHGALKLSASLKEEGPAFVPTLREIALAAETLPARRRDTLKALITLQPDPGFWKDFVREAIESGHGDKFAALACLDSALVLAAIDNLYSSAGPMEKPAIARLLGWFGEKAARFEDKLKELSSVKNYEARYQATLALLRATPRMPEIPALVEAILKTRMARRLSTEVLPEEGRAVILSLPPGESPTQTRLKEIVRIKGPSPVSFEGQICGKASP